MSLTSKISRLVQIPRREWAGYSLSRARSDLLAALTVAAIALPQSMAYAVIAGIHPKYGLYAAIAPVIIASLLGSSKFLISGPTNAISMLIFSSLSAATIGGVSAISLPESEKILLVLTMSLLAGGLQLAMGLARLGSLINFISHSVIIGFSAGAGILIGMNQVRNLLGLHFAQSPHFMENMGRTLKHLPETHWPSLLLGVGALIFILIILRIAPKFPGQLLSIILCAAIVAIFDLGGQGVRLVGEIHRQIPPISWPKLDQDTIDLLFMPSLAIAMLGLVEALSIAKSLAEKSNDRIDGNREFIAQGLANVTAAFFSGMPGSGSFTRSAVNYAAGANSRLAGALSGGLVLATLLLLAPYARYIPIPGLAAILMLISLAMIDRRAIMTTFIATRTDRWVMIITFLATLFLELGSAVFVGVFLSILLFLRRVSHPYVVQVVPREKDNRLTTIEPGDRHCSQAALFRIEGALFFGAIEQLESAIMETGARMRHKAVILIIKHVHYIDASVAHALKQFVVNSKKAGLHIIVADPRNQTVLNTFFLSGMLEIMEEDHLTSSAAEAIDLVFKIYIDPNICQTCPHKVFYECKPAASCVIEARPV
ncbi:MAG: SulP family inorganic anion transporter [Deltaproteobacteria bacterium]|nr:SulP family inorganic anion transporter [Deltaproteobacteria bacterium]